MTVILAALVLASTLHAGPEQALAPAVPESQPYDQFLTAVSAGEDAALVVWRDTIGATRELRAMRIDRDGHPLDARPLLLAPQANYGGTAVRLAHGWMVFGSETDSLVAISVDDEGNVGPGTPLGVKGVAASDGSQLLVLSSGETESFATRFDVHGTVLEQHIPIGSAFFDAAIVPVAGGYRVAVEGRDSIDLLSLDAHGHVVGRTNLVSGEELGGVRAARDGDSLIVAWNSPLGVRAMRVGEAPRTIEAGGWLRDLVPIGGRMHALIGTAGEIVLRAIDGDAERRWDAPLAAATLAASFGDRGLVVINRHGDVLTTLVDASLHEITPLRMIVNEPHVQVNPAVVRSGDGALAAWVEWIDDEDRFVVMGVLLGRYGVPLGRPFRISESAVQWGEVEIATDGEDYLVAWVSGPVYVMTRRVLADGSMPAPEQRIESGWSPRVCVAWTGSSYIVGYTHFVSFVRPSFLAEVHAAVIDREGTPGAPFVVSPRGPVSFSSCAASSSSTLLVWYEKGAFTGAIVTHGGAIQAPFAIGTGEGWLDVASNGTNFLAVWLSGPNIERAAISASGTITRPFDSLAAETTDIRTIDAGISRGEYVVAWSANDIFAVPLASDGSVNGDRAAVSSLGLAPAVAGELIAYQRETETNQRWRVFVRPLLDAPPRRRAVR